MITLKYLFLFFFISFCQIYATNVGIDTLTLQSVNGGVDGVLPGRTYAVIFDASVGVSTVSPQNNGETPNGDVGINISGDTTANIVVEMDLPDHLTGDASMGITFPGSGPGGGVRAETGGFFNPNVTNAFNLGSGGTCKLRLGYVFTVPQNLNIWGTTFTGQINCNVYYISSSEPFTETKQTVVVIRLTINVAAIPLQVSTHNATLDSISRSNTYSVIYHTDSTKSIISPNESGENIIGNLGLDIAGLPTTNIVVEMDLPEYLLGTEESLMPIIFPSTSSGSGVRVETGSFFNPNITNTFNLGSGGTCNLRLGYQLIVPPNIDSLGAIFTAQTNCNIYYSHNTALRTSSILTLTVRVKQGAPVSIALTPVNGLVQSIRKSRTYSVGYNLNNQTSVISPSDSGEAVSGNLGIDIQGSVSDTATIEMNLPFTLLGTHGTIVPITFPSTGQYSGIRIETNQNFNPNVQNIFVLDNNGFCKLRMGYTFTVPSSSFNGEQFTGQIVCKAMNNLGNSVEVETTWTTLSLTLNLNYQAKALLLSPKHSVLDNLTKGSSYSIGFDTSLGHSTISPNNSGEYISMDFGADISGEPDSNVVIEMSLPFSLVGSNSTLLPITFPSTGMYSSVNTATNTFFNPNIANTFNLRSEGMCYLRLGYLIVVPTSISIGDTFSGSVIYKTYYANNTQQKDSVRVNLQAVVNQITDIKNEEVPSQYELKQNFPNPFNPNTAIEFSLIHSGFVSVKILNLLGQEVSTLVSENLLMGKYVKKWNAESFPSGVYYYRLQAGEFVETKKLLLLR